jgi:hypothetical protein
VKAAAALAAKDRPADAADVADLLEDLGAAPSQVAAARKYVEGGADPGSSRAKPCPEAIPHLEKVVADLAKGLDAAEVPAKKGLARILLRIDDLHAGARAALGHKETPSGWTDPDAETIRERRAKIEEAVAAARRMTLAIDTGQSQHPVLLAATQKPGAFAQWKNVSVHAQSATDDQCARQLGDALRATAVSRFIRTGDLSVPPCKRTLAILFLEPDAYDRAVAAAESAKALLYFDGKSAREYGFFHRRDASVFRGDPGDKILREQILFHVWCVQAEGEYGTGYELQPPLSLGHMNWLYMHVLGTKMPDVASPLKAGSSGTSDRRNAPDLAKIALTSTEAARDRLRDEVAARKDAPFTRALVDRWGLLPGELVAKCTFVAEHLQETGELDRCFRTMAGAKPSAALYEKTLGMSLPAFERRWRAWLLDTGGTVRGLLQRLSPPAGTPGGAAGASGANAKADPAVKAFLERIEQARAKAIFPAQSPLAVDTSLSEGCRLHAVYLAAHPEVKDLWPQFLEQKPGAPESTPEGRRAAARSLVAFDVKDLAAALESWLGTIGKRAELLDPGLAGVGLGFSGTIAVVDASSLSGSADVGARALWPAPGATGVPLRASPEQPNLLPGTDPATLGYPITLQLTGQEIDRGLRLRLYEGSGKGEEVPCHLLSPLKSRMPAWHPRGTVALLPERHLRPGTKYRVEVEGFDLGAEWTFTTGR